LFTVDAPLAEIGSDSDSEDDMPDIGRDSDEEDDEDEDEQDFEDSEKEDEDEDEEDEEDSGSDSAPEFDIASENEGEYEETGANAPKITVPKGVVDYDEEEINGKGKGKAVWHDAADERVNVDMEKDNRLKKLARGKKGGVVDGAELQKRLKQQYVHPSLSRSYRDCKADFRFETLHPRPEWADQRTQAGIPSLSTLLSSTKSFIDEPSSSSIMKGKKKRSALKSGTIEMLRLRNANHQSPTTGKQEASNGGSGVVDLAWHPSEKVGVLAVAGGDRRIRFFNVGYMLLRVRMELINRLTATRIHRS
jgi:U3 small nucleolar RNA-associated protein 18